MLNVSGLWHSTGDRYLFGSLKNNGDSTNYSCFYTNNKYIEGNILEDISIDDIAKEVNISPMFLQKGFSIMTGYSIGEYMRNRRLYLAAVDLCKAEEKIIDIAYKYLYETPESFTKAFTRFHGATPKDIRNNTAPINSFLPLRININISGGHNMKYMIKNLEGFKVIGFSKKINSEEALDAIPKFWDEVFEKYANNVWNGNKPANQYEQALLDNHIGEYGICIDDYCKGEIIYLIGGKYEGGAVPDGMMVYEFPKCDWAIFDCIGPMPRSIQNLNDKIYKEWLPENPDYELVGNSSVEWYDSEMLDNQASDYHSAVWIPVKRK